MEHLDFVKFRGSTQVHNTLHVTRTCISASYLPDYSANDKGVMFFVAANGDAFFYPLTEKSNHDGPVEVLGNDLVYQQSQYVGRLDRSIWLLIQF